MERTQRHETRLVDTPGGQTMKSELIPRPRQEPACLESGYEFASRRALAQLRAPLKCLVQMLNIPSLDIRKVQRFMAHRTNELEHPKSLKFELKRRIACFVMLSAIIFLGAVGFSIARFEIAWIISMALLVPALLLILRITALVIPPPPPAEWCEQTFWAYRKAVKSSDHPVPAHIMEIAERIQTLFPAVVLTVIYLYNDAFLCARHETPLGDRECLVVAYWGPHVFPA